MCNQPHDPNCSDKIYQLVKTEIERFVRESVVEPLLEPGLAGVSMIVKFAKAWTNSKLYAKWTARLFAHLDRSYSKINKVSTITGLNMDAFRRLGFAQTRSRITHGVVPQKRGARAFN